MKQIPVRKIKESRKEPDFTGNFSIRKLNELMQGKDLFHELHRHDFYFFLVLENGKGIHEIDFNSYKVQNYSVFILRPGQVHKLELDKKSSGYLMEFDKGFYHPGSKAAKQRMFRAVSKNVCLTDPAMGKRLLTVLADIHREFSGKPDGYPDAIRANLDIFFIEYNRQYGHIEGAGGLTGSYSQNRFEEFMNLLEIHIREKKKVSDYAGMMNLSDYQLNSITRAAVGKPVSGLITEQNLLEAKRLLLATTHQVKDIADQLGFEDISYFIRFFKKHTGVSPEAFRKQFL